MRWNKWEYAKICVISTHRFTISAMLLSGTQYELLCHPQKSNIKKMFESQLKIDHLDITLTNAPQISGVVWDMLWRFPRVIYFFGHIIHGNSWWVRRLSPMWGMLVTVYSIFFYFQVEFWLSSIQLIWPSLQPRPLKWHRNVDGVHPSPMSAWSTVTRSTSLPVCVCVHTC